MAGRRTCWTHIGVCAALGVAAALALAGTAAAGNTTDTDVALTELDVDPREPAPGEETVFGAEVANEGNTTLENVTVVFALDGYHHGNATVDEIPPGERVWTNASTWNATEGNHTLYAVVDDADERNESDETDNELTLAFRVNETPDLGLSYPDPIVVEPTHPTPEEEPTFLVNVTNEGPGDAGNFTVAVEVDSERVASGRVEGLEAGARKRVALGAGGTFSLGDHPVHVVVDPDDEVDETDEYDNDAGTVFTVLPADPPNLAVEDLAVTKEHVRTSAADGPANPLAGQEIRFTFANRGDGPSVARGWVDAAGSGDSVSVVPSAYTEVDVVACAQDPTAPVPDAQDRCDHVATFYPGALTPGQALDLEARWESWGKAGDWTVCVEATYRWEETTTADNTRCQETFVLVGGTGAGGADPLALVGHDARDDVDAANRQVEAYLDVAREGVDEAPQLGREAQDEAYRAARAALDASRDVLRFLEEFAGGAGSGTLEEARRVVEDRPEPEPAEAPTAGEAGHYAVDHGNATYDAAKFMLRSEDERGGEVGTPDSYEDSTEEGLDMVQASLGVEDDLPDFNDSTTQSILDLFVWGVAYGIPDNTACTLEDDPDDRTCATDVTGTLLVDFLLEGFTEQIVPVDAAWGCGHAAVDAADDSPDPQRRCPAPLP